MKILAIESSCDETSVALLHVSKDSFKLQEHVISSQIAIHSKFGGVVPEVAARHHLETLLPLLDKGIGLNKIKEVDLIAVTSGPGLVTSLLVGVETAKALAFSLNKPLVGINHLEGHIYANWISHKELFKLDKKIFPSLALIVSGGHTEWVLMKDHGQYQLLGQTLDDAAGEAFDKVATMLGLPYPGGPYLENLAAQGDPYKYSFRAGQVKTNPLAFSFSGLKTNILYESSRANSVIDLLVLFFC